MLEFECKWGLWRCRKRHSDSGDCDCSGRGVLLLMWGGRCDGDEARASPPFWPYLQQPAHRAGCCAKCLIYTHVCSSSALVPPRCPYAPGQLAGIFAYGPFVFRPFVSNPPRRITERNPHSQYRLSAPLPTIQHPPRSPACAWCFAVAWLKLVRARPECRPVPNVAPLLPECH